MSDFKPLIIKEVRKETADCVSISLEVPEALKTDFKYIPGQYLTFKQEIDGEEIRRSYSICTAPAENDLRVAVKLVPDGRFSTYANRKLKAGDVLETMNPTGNFQLNTASDHQKKYVAFAAGSGITPILSIMKSVLTEEPNSHFTLFYGNKNFDSIIFLEEIEALKNQHLANLSIYHVLSREMLNGPLFSGRIDKERCVTFSNKFFDANTVDAYYVCGPYQMIMDVRAGLEEIGVASEKVNFELFGTAEDLANQVPTKEVEQATETNFDCIVTIIKDGIAIEVPMLKDNRSILDAGLKAGADLPYSCKKGNCCTCRAKVLEGETELRINYALREDELERNYTLSCQTFPLSDKVVVSFDQ